MGEKGVLGPYYASKVRDMTLPDGWKQVEANPDSAQSDSGAKAHFDYDSLQWLADGTGKPVETAEGDGADSGEKGLFGIEPGPNPNEGQRPTEQVL